MVGSEARIVDRVTDWALARSNQHQISNCKEGNKIRTATSTLDSSISTASLPLGRQPPLVADSKSLVNLPLGQVEHTLIADSKSLVNQPLGQQPSLIADCKSLVNLRLGQVEQSIL